MHSISRPRRTAVVLLGLALVVSASGCGKDSSSSSTPSSTSAGALNVNNAWTRPSVSGADTAAVYFTIVNPGGADLLTSVSVPSKIAASAALHETTTSGSTGTTMAGMGTASADGAMSTTTGMAGMTGMQTVDSVDIPAGGTVNFEPGGFHVMLTGLAKPLVLGQQFDITLDFEKAGAVKVTVLVKDE